MPCLSKSGNNNKGNLMNEMRQEGLLDVVAVGLLEDVGHKVLEVDEVVREVDEAGEADVAEIGADVGKVEEGGEVSHYPSVHRGRIMITPISLWTWFPW